MSEFDKEAEREKLREKFERDREKREHTQQMSELLLKGATMTNQHCGECGDPIFSQNGEQFCPTCGVDGGETTAQGAEADASDESPAAEGSAVAEETAAADDRGAAGERTSATGSPSRSATQGDSGAKPNAASTRENAPPNDRKSSGTRTDRGSAASETRSETGSRTTTADDAAVATIEDDITAARASLARSVRQFAEAAEATDDPRRAIDHLEAAREAAAALEAVE